MTDKINELLRRVEEFKPKAAAEIEEFRIRILGKKGELTALMEEFKTVAPELKRELGQQLNRLKNEATERINALREQLQNAAADEASSSGDLTRPGTAAKFFRKFFLKKFSEGSQKACGLPFLAPLHIAR